MISFQNDYSEGACLAIMQRLQETNLQQSSGYGMDEWCEKAKLAIQHHLGNASCDIHFLVGGTQTNLVVIASALRSHEAVISANSGHINVHETGAIEATGHKVVLAKSKHGKLYPEAIEEVMQYHSDEHMVKPKMVYISNATEIGTIYTKNELMALRQVCDQYGLYLYMDGARLAMALCATNNDLSLHDCAKLCDAFYIGGTKCGALFGEAVILCNADLKEDFRYLMKQRGAILAKGRLLGIQFYELFHKDLYFTLASHANTMAQKVQKAMEDIGIAFLEKTTTNQIFPILSKDMMVYLQQKYAFQFWESYDEQHDVVRFVTSWATKQEDVELLIQDIQRFHKG